MRVAVGFFDGVHLGHQAILKGADAALTFANHPLSVLAPERAPRLVMTAERRVAAIRACGVGDVTVLEFTPELAAMEPARFLEVARIGRHAEVRCGENWRFGRGGAGDARFLRERGIAVEVVPYATHGGERISSSRIRACLERGEVEDANAMMGRRFAVGGEREKGKGVGAKIGFPTVNFRLPSLRLRLPRGVYEVKVAGREGVANFGLAPTMGAAAWSSPVLEVHFGGEVDGGRMESATVEFVRFLRPERTFASVAELTRQIAEDCRRVGL